MLTLALKISAPFNVIPEDGGKSAAPLFIVNGILMIADVSPVVVEAKEKPVFCIVREVTCAIIAKKATRKTICLQRVLGVIFLFLFILMSTLLYHKSKKSTNKALSVMHFPDHSNIG